MDSPFEDLREEGPIEDYLFGSYNANKDQQFAKPIEDEDLFGICDDQEVNTESNATEPTSAQTKMKLFKEKILEQARARNLKPKKLGTGFREDGTIDVVIDQYNCESSKSTFNKFFNKTRKAKEISLSSASGLTWDEYKDLLRKQISADKRKVWDSFQQPDNLCDEEEMIENLET